MPDGTLYAGISPDTGKPIYTMSEDAPLTMTFNEAKDYAAKLDAHSHKDWRVPTKGELNVLFNNRSKIGGFKENVLGGAGFYWSSSETSSYAKPRAWCKRFSDGASPSVAPFYSHSVRFVR